MEGEWGSLEVSEVSGVLGDDFEGVEVWPGLWRGEDLGEGVVGEGWEGREGGSLGGEFLVIEGEPVDGVGWFVGGEGEGVVGEDVEGELVGGSYDEGGHRGSFCG